MVQSVGWPWCTWPPGTHTGHCPLPGGGGCGGPGGGFGCISPQFTRCARLHDPASRSNNSPFGHTRSARNPKIHSKYRWHSVGCGRLTLPFVPHCVQSTVPAGEHRWLRTLKWRPGSQWPIWACPRKQPTYWWHPTGLGEMMNWLKLAPRQACCWKAFKVPISAHKSAPNTTKAENKL